MVELTTAIGSSFKPNRRTVCLQSAADEVGALKCEVNYSSSALVPVAEPIVTGGHADRGLRQ